MTAPTIRHATDDDIATVADLWTEAAAWLGQRGTDQWQYPIKMHNIRNAVAARTCWIVEDPEGTPIGTVTLDQNAEAELWQPDDQPDQALYVHRLVVGRSQRGQDLGAAILDWASLRAEAEGKRWLRLDAWTSNTGLHRYYLNHGFRHVRTVTDVPTPSAVLFERPAGKVEGLGQALTTID